MNLNRGLTSVLGTVATAAAVTAVAAATPSHASAETFAPYTGQATANLNVREQPDTSSARIATLKKGDSFQVVGVEGRSAKGNWLKINYQNKTAYVDGYYVGKKTAAKETTQAVQNVSAYQGTTTENLNVRFLPASKGTILTTLKKGSTVTVTGKTADGWLQINYKSGSAYVSEKYIQTVSQTKVSADVTAAATKAVNYGGTTTANLNVRKGASTSNSIITTLKKGSAVSVVGTSGSWLKIKIGGSYGWVSAQYVSKKAATASSSAGNQETATTLYTGATTANLNVRKSASASSSILTTLKKGSAVYVVGSSGDWLKIKYNNGSAWVSKQYVDKPKDSQPASSGSNDSNGSGSAAVLYQGTTTANLNVRKSASTSSSILTTLKEGSAVDVVGTTGNWLEIKYKSGTAYVSKDYVQAAADTGTSDSNAGSGQTSTSEKIQGVITTACHFRQSPDTSSKVYQTLSTGTIVDWLADGPDGWVKVSYNGQDGYVYDDYVDKETQTTISSGNTATTTTQYGISFAAAVAKEQKVNSSSSIAKYMNPNNFTPGTAAYYQFLQLSSLANVSASDINKALQGRGILSGCGQAFIDAANATGVNEVYLVAHALLETGNGTSTLAKGVTVNGEKVYNMFGIGAVDNNPLGGGSQTAYANGWTTPAAAIKGGAEWIATHYVYNSAYNQDTLYKMRWNPQALVAGNAAHQYATDVAWAVSQTSMISSIYGMISGANLVFDVPSYAN
ncbi:MAG: SH3 domain-containing protein [Sporolactobacillus sp.]